MSTLFFLFLLLLVVQYASSFFLRNFQEQCFPSNFLFGSGNAKYEYEERGNATTSDSRRSFCNDNATSQCRNLADNARNKSEFMIMKKLGLNSYRFSISWSRVCQWDAITNKMVPNEVGIKFYHEYIDEILSRKLKPILTIYYRDIPGSLNQYLNFSGWLNPAIIDHYLDFCLLLFTEYGSKIPYWATFYEPLSYAMQEYHLNYSSSIELMNEYRVGHHLLLSHAKAVSLFRELQKYYLIPSTSKISIILNSDSGFPLNSSLDEDIYAVEKYMQFSLGWWLYPIVYGDYPSLMKNIVSFRLPEFSTKEKLLLKGSYDLFMLNHYTTNLITECSSSRSLIDCKDLRNGWNRDVGVDKTRFPKGSHLSSTSKCLWFAGVPGHGYLKAIQWLHKHNKHAEILLTENGWCGNRTLDNSSQLWYYQTYIHQVYEAIQLGIPIIGYLSSSLLDYKKEKSQDFLNKTQLRRKPKVVLLWYAKLAKSHCLKDQDFLFNIMRFCPSIQSFLLFFFAPLLIYAFVKFILSKTRSSSTSYGLKRETTPLLIDKKICMKK